jgi:muramoyltetrapeptide carboxypeptidase
MTRPVIRPPAVTPEPGVAIVSTSSPISADELDRVVAYFTDRGHPVTVAPHARASSGYLAGHPADRAADLMASFADPSIGLIVPTTGGKGAVQLLELLDYDTIAASPKVFTALSDPVVLANAITARTGLATLHGPTGFDFSRPTVNQTTGDAFWQNRVWPGQRRRGSRRWLAGRPAARSTDTGPIRTPYSAPRRAR